MISPMSEKNISIIIGLQKENLSKYKMKSNKMMIFDRKDYL